MRSAWISGAEGTGGDRGSNERRRHSLIRGQFSVFVDPSPRLSPTIMPSHASSQAHCSSGSSRTASDRLSRRRHSDGDTPIIEDRPSNSAPVRARNAAKLQKFQRRRQNGAGEIDDLKRSVSYPKSSAPDIDGRRRVGRKGWKSGNGINRRERRLRRPFQVGRWRRFATFSHEIARTPATAASAVPVPYHCQR